VKKVVVLVLVLIAVVCSDLFSETLDCRVSFMLGRITAVSEYRSWRWFLLGLGSSIPTVAMLGLEYSGVFQDYDSWALFAEYAAFVPLFIPLIPSLLFPQRETIHAPNGIEVALDSYRGIHFHYDALQYLRMLLGCIPSALPHSSSPAGNSSLKVT
jgi:hypothetical protein